MKVLSLLQPWATLAATGAKKMEVRNWKTLHRGPLLIHASSKRPSVAEKAFFEEGDYFKNFLRDVYALPYGAIIGQVTLVDVFSTQWLMGHLHMEEKINWAQELAFDDFSANRYAWYFEEAIQMEPIPIKGRLGLWEYKGA